MLELGVKLRALAELEASLAGLEERLKDIEAAGGPPPPAAPAYRPSVGWEAS